MTPAFWIGAAALTGLALAFLLVPWWRERRQSGGAGLSAALTAAAIVPVAVGLYFLVSTYDPAAEADRPVANAGDLALLEQLAARLDENPDDVEGWMLLGRSYRSLQDYGRARMAFEQAWERTDNPDTMLKLLYAESMLFSDPGTAAGQAGELIDEVLAEAPGNQSGLLLGGIAAAESGRRGLAAERFTALLASNPPPQIADFVRQQVTALTGAPPAGAAAGAIADGPVIEVEIRVADGMMPDSLGPQSYVYLFARAPAGGPPIVARQIAISELPGRFELGNADAMMAGRDLTGQDKVTVVARISVSGQPTAQPGDVFGEVEVEPAAEETVSLTLDQVVPSA